MKENQSVSIQGQSLAEWEAVDKDLKEFLDKFHEYERHIDRLMSWAGLGIVKRLKPEQKIKLYLLESMIVSTVLNQGEALLKKYKEISGPYLKAFPGQESGVPELITYLEETVENLKTILKFFLGHPN